MPALAAYAGSQGTGDPSLDLCPVPRGAMKPEA